MVGAGEDVGDSCAARVAVGHDPDEYTVADERTTAVTLKVKKTLFFYFFFFTKSIRNALHLVAIVRPKETTFKAVQNSLGMVHFRP